jgi:rhomboid protease GluP
MEKRRMCPHCRAFITTNDRTCPYCNEAVGPTVRQRTAPILGGFIPHARFNTMVIMIINFGLFAATAIYSMQGGRGNAMGLDNRTVILFGAMSGGMIQEYGQWWRLVTAGFLHGGLMHILFNSWALFDLGAIVEEMFGSSRMLVIYFVSTVTGFYASYRIGTGLSVGASAALFGLIGAMIALGTRHRSSVGGAIRGFFVRWLIYGMLFSLMPGVDMAAHVGGLAGGFALGYVAGEPRYEGSLTEKLWRVASWLCVGLTVLCFLKWYLWYHELSSILQRG